MLLQVAGSRSADVSTKGQRADHKIVRRSWLPLLPNGPAAVAWAGSGCLRLLHSTIHPDAALRLLQVEVALFFQQEVLREAAPGSSSAHTAPAAASTAAGTPASSGRGPLTAGSFPALLLSGDNAQVQTARSHGLPAARRVDVAAAQRQLEAALQRQPQQPLTASLLRSCLGAAAVTGAGFWCQLCCCRRCC